jgi:hypothetical protein
MKIAYAAFKAKANEQEISKVQLSARSIAITESSSNMKARIRSSAVSST